MYLHRILSLAAVLTIGAPKLALAQCPVLTTNSPADELTAFLRSSKELPAERQDRDCIQFALEQLGSKHSLDAIPVLVDYLDFERPLTEAEREGFSFHGSRKYIGGTYIASSSLFTFGKVAVPALVSAIKTRESPLIRRNATYTIMQVFRAEPFKGIELLEQEALASPPPVAANLRAAVLFALKWCDERNRRRCEAATHAETR